MASPPFLILELKPGDADLISAHPSDERSFRDIVESWLLIDHDNNGLHNKVQLPERADPTLVANVGILYSKDVGGVTELHYIDSGGTVKQITSAGKLLIASADLPNGVVLTAALAAGAVDGTKLAMGSDAQGDVLFYGGAAYKRLAPGTSGQFLQTKGAGADPVWATVAGLPTPDFTSAEQTVTVDTLLEVAHSGGAVPTLIQVALRCKTADSGYSVDDEIAYYGGPVTSTVGNRGASIGADATNVFVVQASAITVVGKSSFNQDLLTTANWRWVIKSWK